MERLVLKTFLKFLEDKEVVEYCEKLSELIEDDFKAVFSDIKSKSRGKIIVPEIQNCIKCIEDVTKTLLSFIKSIKALHYHGLNENRASKDALALKDYAPLNKFVLGIEDLIKSARTICRKCVVDCKKANETICTVINKCSGGDSFVIGATTAIGTFFSGAVVGGLLFTTFGLAGAVVAIAAGVGVGYGAAEAYANMPELKKLFQCMSKIMKHLIETASQLCGKLEHYYEDIDFSIQNFQGMQGSLSSEDRSHIFITLDCICHACHNQYQQSGKWKSKVSELKKYV